MVERCREIQQISLCVSHLKDFKVLKRWQLTKLKELKRIVVEDEGLQVGETTSLRWKGVKEVIGKIKEEQVGQVYEESRWNLTNSERKFIKFENFLIISTH